ncbi:hypothetical protein Zmor_002398 [Zophobas morio]|uniref:Odorant receptor n=1 Tax=Zophobas morio TaxID=2755281 RepID=A0AA38MTK5_9CUCU|nr:hypothetical protein Zmor_002398 [Zophobas morio]
MKDILKTSFKLNLKVLLCVGLYPSDSFKYVHKIFAYIVYIVATLPPFVLGSLNFFLKGNVDREDYNDFVTVALILLAPKLLLFLINSDNLKTYITFFDVKFVTAVNEKQRKIIESWVKICQRNSTIFFGTTCIGLVGFFAKWYFQGYHSHLPLNVWIPFNSETQPLLYFFIYTALVIGGVYAAMACGTIDSLVPGLLCHVSGQLQLLKDNLQNLDFYVEEIRQVQHQFSRNLIILRQIKQSVLHYKDISYFVEEYEKCFSTMVFSQFIESIVVIGLCCLQMTKIRELDAYSLIMVVYLGILLFQVYFYCYYGTIVYEENNSVSTAIYMSNWYEYNTKAKKILLVLMQRSQRHMIVSAESILDLSLDTFITILKRSYSLIAVFKNYY